MSDELTVSAEGLQKMKADLGRLKTEERVRIAEAIREAKSHGDLKENAMYHEARLNQSRLEARIAELERAVEHARIVDHSEVEEGTIHLGSSVKLLDIKWKEESSIDIVGAFEADPDDGRISIGSPMGTALKGKTEGDEVEVETPGGTQHYRIISVD